MKLRYSPERIELQRDLTDLDRFALQFIKVLDHHKVKYIVVSGYIAILFGRTRQTEDIDIVAEPLPKERFLLLWHDLLKTFGCLNTDDPINAYDNYLSEDTGIRFAEPGEFAPNIEFKFSKTKYDKIGFHNRVCIDLTGNKIFTTPMETQIAFKLYLGSDKDFEDARHLYGLFKEDLNIPKLQYCIKDLRVEKQAERVLGLKCHE